MVCYLQHPWLHWDPAAQPVIMIVKLHCCSLFVVLAHFSTQPTHNTPPSLIPQASPTLETNYLMLCANHFIQGNFGHCCLSSHNFYMICSCHTVPLILNCSNQLQQMPVLQLVHVQTAWHWLGLAGGALLQLHQLLICSTATLVISRDSDDASVSCHCCCCITSFNNR